MNSWLPKASRVLLVVLPLCVCLLFGYRVWRNSQVLAQSKDVVREALNKALKGRKIDPLTVVDLPSASRVFGVPERVDFEQYLFRTDDVAGRRPAGKLTGTFNRKTGEMQVDMEFLDGKRERGLREKLKAVP